MPSSRGSFQPKNGTQVSHIAGRFFTTESPGKPLVYPYTEINWAIKPSKDMEETEMQSKEAPF